MFLTIQFTSIFDHLLHFHLVHNFITIPTLRILHKISGTKASSCIAHCTSWNYLHISSKMQLPLYWSWYFCTQNRGISLQISYVPDHVDMYIIRNFFQNTKNGMCTKKLHTSNGIWYNLVVPSIDFFVADATMDKQKFSTNNPAATVIRFPNDIIHYSIIYDVIDKYLLYFLHFYLFFIILYIIYYSYIFY